MDNLLLQFNEIKAKLTYTEELLTNSNSIINNYNVQNKIYENRIEYLENCLKQYQTSFEEQDKYKKIKEPENIIDKCTPIEEMNSSLIESNISLEDKIVLLEAKLEISNKKNIDLEEKIYVRDSQLQNCDEVTTHLKNKILELEGQLSQLSLFHFN